MEFVYHQQELLGPNWRKLINMGMITEEDAMALASQGMGYWGNKAAVSLVKDIPSQAAADVAGQPTQ